MRKMRRDLETDETVDTLGLIVNLTQDVAGVAHVGREQLLVDLLGGRTGSGCSSKIVIVVGALRDRLFENRRIGRDPAQAFFCNATGQVAGHDHASVQIIHPAALTVVDKLDHSVHLHLHSARSTALPGPPAPRSRTTGISLEPLSRGWGSCRQPNRPLHLISQIPLGFAWHRPVPGTI
jgi:hypothetical protein